LQHKISLNLPSGPSLVDCPKVGRVLHQGSNQ
ncbi:hypothetical protein T07_6142, partial [Trichinella nelsoni]